MWFGKRLILIAAVFQFFDAMQLIAAGGLRGAGDTKIPMIIALGMAWFLFLPLAYVLGTVLDWGVVGAWSGATVYIIMLGTAMYLRLRLGGWTGFTLLEKSASETQPD